MDLFAGLRVADRAAAISWYAALLGDDPMMLPNDAEAVWQLGEGQFVYVQEDPRPGHGLVTLFVDDLDRRVADAAGRGVEPASSETYDNGVRKVTYRDPDGNEIGFGGGPA